MYTNTFGILPSTSSMSHWKLAGQPNSPMGEVIQWNWPLPNCQFLCVFIQFHLPESGSEVQGGEDGGIGSPKVADTSGEPLHGVFVDVGVLVELPEVLDDPESLALFHWNAENGEIIE
jgi:hypothetical protein